MPINQDYFSENDIDILSDYDEDIIDDQYTQVQHKKLIPKYITCNNLFKSYLFVGIAVLFKIVIIDNWSN